jgi:hypothetical protein
MYLMISSWRTGDVYCQCTSRDRKRGLHRPARVSTTAVVMSPLEQPHLNIHYLWVHQSCLFGRNAARCGAAACRNISPASPRSQQHGREMSETLQQVMFLSGWRPVCGSRVRQFASEPCTFRCSRASCLASTAGRSRSPGHDHKQLLSYSKDPRPFSERLRALSAPGRDSPGQRVLQRSSLQWQVLLI